MADAPREFNGPAWVGVSQTIGGGMRRSHAPRACDASHLQGKPAFAGTLPETDYFASNINQTYKPGVSRPASISPLKDTTAASPTKKGPTRKVVAKGIAPGTINLPSFNLDVKVQSKPGKFGKPITALVTSTPSRKLVKTAYKSISIPPLPRKRSKKTKGKKAKATPMAGSGGASAEGAADASGAEGADAEDADADTDAAGDASAGKAAAVEGAVADTDTAGDADADSSAGTGAGTGGKDDAGEDAAAAAGADSGGDAATEPAAADTEPASTAAAADAAPAT